MSVPYLSESKDCVHSGNIVWDAAVGMHHYFMNREYFPQGYWKGRKVLELGSGTGLGTSGIHIHHT